MKLGKIQSEDLLFTRNIDDNRTNTLLTLDDYDWMNYTLSTKFKTSTHGEIKVVFRYFGITISSMKATVIKDNESKEYEFEYSTDLFVKHITTYMKKHIESWNSKYAFNGEDEVLAFYNEIVTVGKLI